ncbi:CCA tRNA nucleotidyltransferase [Novipirellula aureliae]|uniref:CCA tRNA nucleotidyltransferase n=1 Tax=Novipirellula aureliae TaxID=2527966 RepID=UPI001E3276E5|nr:CCA tRNA nucleotidyltransferase [Novipirellula aureliae]
MKSITTPYEFPDQSLKSAQAIEALVVVKRLSEAGFTAYFAGGCVRDALLGKAPKDFDVATDAVPAAIQELFGKRKTLAFGASFGVIGVLPSASDRRKSIVPITPTEVATFRSDGLYSDGRRPDSVHFGNAEADAQRRDFTINGLFYDPIKRRIVDYVGGVEDIERQLLRTIGNPHERFSEDKLRMLRAVRFTTTLGFSIAEPTADAVRGHAASIGSVSGERIGVEMRRTMSSNHALDGLGHLQALGLSRYVLPELEKADRRLLDRLLTEDRTQDFSTSLACILLAIDEPMNALRSITERWKLSNEEVRVVTSAIHHSPTLIRANTLPWAEVQPILVDRDAEAIVEVSAALARATDAPSSGIHLALEALKWPRERLDPNPLIGGDDLKDLGVPTGPVYAKLLRQVRQRQLNGEFETKAQAVAFVKGQV